MIIFSEGEVTGEGEPELEFVESEQICNVDARRDYDITLITIVFISN